MQLHEVTQKNPNTKARQVGRGGKRGKTSGKGMKGQKSRAGRKLRPELRDIIKKIPKRRGYGKNRGRTVNPERVVPESVNLSDLESLFDAGDAITPVQLLSRGLVRRQKGKLPVVKVLAKGKLTKKLTITKCLFSDKAKSAIVEAGGTIS